MKRFLAIALLVASSAQAHELKKAWDNFGKGNRLVSAGKAVIDGAAGVAMVDVALHSGVSTVDLMRGKRVENFGIFGIKNKFYVFVQYLFLTGVSSYAAWGLLYHQFWQDAKHALGVKQGYFS